MTKLDLIRKQYKVPAFRNGVVLVQYGGRESAGTIVGADTNLRLRVRLDCFSANDVILVRPDGAKYLACEVVR